MMYLFKCSFRELFRKKRRTTTTMLGYVIAVTASALLALVMLKSHDESSAILKHTGTHFMAFKVGCGKVNCGINLLDNNDGFAVHGIQTLRLSEDDVLEIRKFPSVKDASLFLAFRFYDSIPERRCSIGGFDPANGRAVATNCCASTDLLKGRFLTSADTANTVLIHESYFRLRKLDIGDTISIGGNQCIVVGIINPGIRPANADIYCSIQLARKLVNKRLDNYSLIDEGNVILVETTSSIMHEEALRSLKKKNYITETYACYKPAASVLGINKNSLQYLLMLIALMTVAFAFKTQFSSVSERSKEFAILQAIGWKNKTIVNMVTIESLLLTIAGWSIGLMITGCSLLIMHLFKMQGEYPVATSLLPIMLTALLTLFLVLFPGIAAGLISGYFARRLKPSDIFRRP